MLPDDQEFQAHLFSRGWELLVTDGVRSFTVENLAADMGISKKTIYQVVPSKEALIANCVQSTLDTIYTNIHKIVENEPNPARQFLQVGELVAEFTSQVKIRRMLDLKNRYPGIWEQIEDFRFQRLEQFRAMLIAAQEQGYIKDDIDIDQFSFLLMQMINTVFQPEVLIGANYAVGAMIRMFFKTITQGLFTAKGIANVEDF